MMRPHVLLSDTHRWRLALSKDELETLSIPVEAVPWQKGVANIPEMLVDFRSRMTARCRELLGTGTHPVIITNGQIYSWFFESLLEEFGDRLTYVVQTCWAEEDLQTHIHRLGPQTFPRLIEHSEKMIHVRLQTQDDDREALRNRYRDIFTR